MTTVRFKFDAITEGSCLACGWEGPAAELLPIRDFQERVMPGEFCPAGECPRCGSLAHLMAPDDDESGWGVQEVEL